LSHKRELILDFIQEITIGGIETGHLGGQRDKILNNLVDNVADTVLSIIANDGRLKEHVVSFEIYLNVENRRQAMVLVVLDRQLVQQVLHRTVDTFGNSLDNEAVQVVDVLSPGF
jgi:hypothetical protein